MAIKENTKLFETQYTDEVIDKADDAADDGLISDLSNLNSHPVYVSGCKYDRIVDQFNQLLQFEFYEHYKAATLRKQDCHPGDEKFAHIYLDSAPYDSLQYVLSGIPKSNVSKSKKLTEPATWEEVKSKGVLTKFDQDALVFEAFQETYNDDDMIFD